MLKQPWIDSALVDIPFILLPGILSTFFVLFFGKYTNNTEDLPFWTWLIFVLLIDVAHVYASLFRTYFDRKELQKNTFLYVFVPIICWFIGIVLYSFNALYFWRFLAYVAVFHFVRQQYGFFAIYKRYENIKSFKADEYFLYLSMLYPLVFWHTHLPRKFSWFVDGDFVLGLSKILEPVFWGIYLVLGIIYLFQEAKNFIQNKVFNLPKNLLIFSTACTWYVGIVLLNGDLAFTITNVVAHGIPYMALVFLYERKKHPKNNWRVFHSVILLIVFLFIIFGFAFIEEGLWDALIWREHPQLFYMFQNLPDFSESATAIWLVPLLSLPQFSHYVLDAFIWKMKKSDSQMEWTNKLFKV